MKRYRIVKTGSVYVIDERRYFLFIIPYWSRLWEAIGSLAGVTERDLTFADPQQAEAYINSLVEIDVEWIIKYITKP